MTNNTTPSRNLNLAPQGPKKFRMGRPTIAQGKRAKREPPWEPRPKKTILILRRSRASPSEYKISIFPHYSYFPFPWSLNSARILGMC